jgi:hypothetical protein
MSQPQPESPRGVLGTETQSADAAIAFRVRIGHSVLAPTTKLSALRAAIEKSNRGLSQPGLTDTLNPDIIDVDKAMALLAALPAIVRRSPQLLAGRELYLTNAGLRIGSADPTTLDGFNRPFDLEVEDIQGDTLLARSTVPVVLQLARERAAEAKIGLMAENARIKPLEARLQAEVAANAVEKQRSILDELTPARQRRSALARVWWGNARELSERPGADAAAKAETEAALRAVNEFLLPSGAGMPR